MAPDESRTEVTVGVYSSRRSGSAPDSFLQTCSGKLFPATALKRSSINVPKLNLMNGSLCKHQLWAITLNFTTGCQQWKFLFPLTNDLNICWPGGCVWWFMLMIGVCCPSHKAPWGQVLRSEGGKTHKATMKQRWTCVDVYSGSNYAKFEICSNRNSLVITKTFHTSDHTSLFITDETFGKKLLSPFNFTLHSFYYIFSALANHNPLNTETIWNTPD